LNGRTTTGRVAAAAKDRKGGTFGKKKEMGGNFRLSRYSPNRPGRGKRRGSPAEEKKGGRNRGGGGTWGRGGPRGELFGYGQIVIENRPKGTCG